MFQFFWIKLHYTCIVDMHVRSTRTMRNEEIILLIKLINLGLLENYILLLYKFIKN